MQLVAVPSNFARLHERHLLTVDVRLLVLSLILINLDQQAHQSSPIAMKYDKKEVVGIVDPPAKFKSLVWQYFGFPKYVDGTVETSTICKLCKHLIRY